MSNTKHDAGVKEYWIIDPAKETITVYNYQRDEAPLPYNFIIYFKGNSF